MEEEDFSCYQMLIMFVLLQVRRQRREEAEREVQRSEEYIQRLQQEEVRRIEEERREQEKLKKQDEELARRIAEVITNQLTKLKTCFELKVS